MKLNKIKYLCMLTLVITLSGCGIKDKKTTLGIKDPDRHYFPVLRGQSLDIIYEVENTGKNPLFITDIQTSCGCMLVKESSFKVLPSGGKGFIELRYDSSKNIGYVKHYLTIYANLESSDKFEATFDLHVVPNALYTEDYEELYEQIKDRTMDLVDGNENNLSYYTGDQPM